MNTNPPPAQPSNPNVVDSLLHPHAIVIRELLTRPGRQERRAMLIDDEENIVQALEAGVQIQSVYYSGDDVVSDELRKVLPATVTIHEVARRTCKKLFENDRISRVFAVAKNPAPLRLSDLLRAPKDIVALEGLSITGNIGSILRTSLAFGVGGIVLLNTDPVDVYDRRIIRSSRGYIFSMPVTTASTDEFVQFCKQNHLPILVTDAKADHLIEEVPSINERLAIILGSEKEGSSPELMKAAAWRVRIPTSTRVESLNVSTAAGIVLFHRAKFNQAW
jgi:TrmH family RNA methyltransferase